MLDYPGLDTILQRMDATSAEAQLSTEIIPRLVDIWVEDYMRTAAATDVVETTVEGLSYLFDIETQRLIAAWGISRGRQSRKRDVSRIARHPQSAGKQYHRGHAIAHTLGGGADINLVTQLGSVNIGPFRALEHEATRTRGALYFTYWKYDRSDSQRPIEVQQGLLVPGRGARLRCHGN
jgi:hypothetical protein